MKWRILQILGTVLVFLASIGSASACNTFGYMPETPNCLKKIE
ncbi:cyclic lactone autoinducer peptide [Heliobacillus mobilis]|uniref:Cyclic lactone autoinducer peptide n=1 Tax=Heliobacterium mobile TaxID=28064 RepID=A0A6I3SLI0_HELMO|nr:cyclic lactone autoinducer peptide [Heliobacterium mobile]